MLTHDDAKSAPTGPPPAYTAGPSRLPSTPAYPPPTNGLALSSRHEALAGLYVLDPAVPPVPDGGRRRGARLPREAKRAAKGVVPCAVASTRHGAISLQLAVVGDAPCGAPALVSADTHSGDIVLDVLEKSPQRMLTLVTSTRRGDTTVLLPPTFAGIVELRTRRGRADVLPGLAPGARVLRRAGAGELRLLVGPTDAAGAAGNDFVRLDARLDALRVGASGADGAAAQPVDLVEKVMRMAGDFVAAKLARFAR